MLENLVPRNFCDFTVPQRSDGSYLKSCIIDGDYELYLNWLNSHLFSNEFPLSDAQQNWILDNNEDPEKVIFNCSDNYGYAFWELNGIENHFADGGTWDGLVQSYKSEGWETLSDEEREGQTFREWFNFYESIYNRLRTEWLQHLGENWNHADIPYRSLLAWALKQIPDSGKRSTNLDKYFHNFNENRHK